MKRWHGVGVICLWTVVLVMLLDCAYGELKHLTIVFRHGARTHLNKEDDPLEGESEAELLLQGEGEAQDLGVYIRRKYGGEITGIEDERIVSSNLLRTLSTAARFADGLSSQTIPVQVDQIEENDFLIRAYTKCPTFSKRLNAFHDSQEFKSKASEEADFIQEWSKGFNEDEDLLNWINVYDKYNLAKNYPGDNVESPTNGKSIDDVSDEILQEMKSLAEWVETRRYGPERVGKEVSATLVSRINQQLADVYSGRPTTRITAYSAHYPTMLSLYSSLSGKMFDRLPNFCDALLLEAHDDGLKLMFFNREAEETIDYTEELCEGDSDICDYNAVKKRFEQQSASSISDSCSLCSNSEAPVCSEPSSGMSKVGIGFLGAVLGIFVTLLVGAILISVRRRHRSPSYTEDELSARKGYVPDLKDDLKDDYIAPLPTLNELYSSSDGKQTTHQNEV